MLAAYESRILQRISGFPRGAPRPRRFWLPLAVALDQNSPHDLGRRCERMRAAVPVRSTLRFYHGQILTASALCLSADCRPIHAFFARIPPPMFDLDRVQTLRKCPRIETRPHMDP